MRAVTRAQNRHFAPSDRRRLGVTLIELVVVVGVIGALLGMSWNRLAAWSENQRVRDAARTLADTLLLARVEAMRTGHNHVVFFGNPGQTDPSGNDVESGGSWVPVLVIDDGTPATANCKIENGEEEIAIEPTGGLSWGVSFATSKVDTDDGDAPFNPGGWDGATFADASNNKINWVLFRPDGIPVAFTGAFNSCGTIHSTGSGGGAFYVTNDSRDYAVVLTPMGIVRVHTWDRSGGGWTD